jgi:hypothetical protein
MVKQDVIKSRGSGSTPTRGDCMICGNTFKWCRDWYVKLPGGPVGPLARGPHGGNRTGTRRVCAEAGGPTWINRAVLLSLV